MRIRENHFIFIFFNLIFLDCTVLGENDSGHMPWDDFNSAQVMISLEIVFLVSKILTFALCSDFCADFPTKATQN